MNWETKMIEWLLKVWTEWRMAIIVASAWTASLFLLCAWLKTASSLSDDDPYFPGGMA